MVFLLKNELSTVNADSLLTSFRNTSHLFYLDEVKDEQIKAFSVVSGVRKGSVNDGLSQYMNETVKGDDTDKQLTTNLYLVTISVCSNHDVLQLVFQVVRSPLPNR